MYLSVVIPVYNGAATLTRCLQALSASQHKQWECIVVDDGSTDSTLEIAERFGVRALSTGGRRGPACARNLGADAAIGDTLVFLDADVALHPDALTLVVQAFHDQPGLDAVIGAYDDTPADPGFISQYRNLMHCFVHRQGRTSASTFWTGCGAVRRSVFLAHGGLDESYLEPAIEDIEFGMRMHQAGCELALNPAIQCQHMKNWGLWNLLYADVFLRGIPWTKLILRARHAPNDLNLRWDQRLSVLLTALLLGLLLTASWAMASLVLAAIVVVNREFYVFLARHRGFAFAGASIPMHLLYFCCCGLAFGLGAGAVLLQARPTHSPAAKERKLSPAALGRGASRS
ncbi:MAG: glycosyltransferase family 2 protein [Bryobacterales bacterium]|nr:glycosyltransferase family 2 protein [Bryobacterales bacterium]